jgi:hypothetical protein
MATQVTLNSGSVDSAGSLALKTNGTTTAITINSSQGVEFLAGTAALPAITTTGDTNTGIFFPAADTIGFSEGGAEVARFDSSGNFGLGVTPSAWASNYKAIQLPNGASLAATTNVNRTYLYNNVYQPSGSPVYVNSDFATYQVQLNGQFQWHLAPSGTAGNTASFTQAMTLDASGNLLVGTTSTAGNAGFQVLPNANATGSALFSVNHITGSASGHLYASFNFNGSGIGSITQSGTTAVLFNVTSDQRLKENIVDADSASSLIDSLQVRKFDWKTDNTHQRYGFIAQELVTVAPEAVHQPINGQDMMAVDYSKLVPMLVKEIQSLRKRLASAGI